MKKKKHKIFDVKLDEEEQTISDFLDGGKLKSVSNLEKEIAFAREAAASYLRRGCWIEARIHPKEPLK